MKLVGVVSGHKKFRRFAPFSLKAEASKHPLPIIPAYAPEACDRYRMSRYAYVRYSGPIKMLLKRRLSRIVASFSGEIKH